MRARMLMRDATRAKARVAFFLLAISFLCAPPPFLFAQDAEPTGDPGKSPETEITSRDEEKTVTPPTDVEKARKKQSGDVFTMGEVVVKGEAIAHIDEAATSTELTDKDLQARGSRTLDEALSAVQGVQVETHQKGHSRIKIRGFDQDKIAILVDGVPVADVYSTDIDISDLTVKNISRIYINRGVSSALYGASGAAGAINIVSKKPETPFLRGGGEYGMYNNYTFDAAAGGPWKNLYGWITGSVENSDGYRPSRNLDRAKKIDWFNKLVRYYIYGANLADMNVPGPWQYLLESGRWNNTEYRKYNTSARVGYELNDKLDVGISARFNYGSGKTNTYQNRCYSDYKINKLEWGEPVFRYPIPSQVKKACLANRSFLWPEKYAFSVSPYAKFTQGIFGLKLQSFYSQRFTEQEGYLDNAHLFAKDPPAVLRKDTSVYEPVYDYKTYESYGVQAYPSVSIASWNRLTMAVLWRGDEMLAQQKAKSPLLSPETTRRYGNSRYKVNYLKAYFLTVAIEDEISVQDRLKITAGVSYDAQNFIIHKGRNPLNPLLYHDAYRVKGNSMLWGTRDSFNPVAGIVFNAIEDLLAIKTAFSMKTRFPTLGEYEKVSDIRYDRGIKSERSYNFNIGPTFTFFDDSLEFGSDYFFSIIKNRIEKIAGGEEPPVNIKRVDSHGMETHITYKIARVMNIFDIDTSVFYTFLHSRNHDTSWEENVNKGELMENTPAHQFIADIRFAFVSGTSIGIWGTALIDQVMYAMRARPPTGPPSFYSRKFFTTVRLHDQFNLNVRVGQKIWDHFELYLLCKNILDDYNPDPFNPGPGVMVYGGFEAKL